MKIFSGECLIGNCGETTGLFDVNGDELFSGDIVYAIPKSSILENEEIEYGDCTCKLVVLFDTFETVKGYKGELTHYVSEKNGGWIFGLKSANLEEWLIKKFKNWQDIENGFFYDNYRYSEK